MKKGIRIAWLCLAMLFSLLAADRRVQAAENCPEGDCSRKNETVQRDNPLTVENRFKAFPKWWEVFEDADYGFVVAYPRVDWVINTNIDQMDNLHLPLRERSLSDSTMHVTISVFDNQGFRTTEEWLKSKEAIYALMDPVRITPIKVNGHEGLYYISDDPTTNAVDVFIRNVKYVIRLTYEEITNQEADMDTFWTMLKSLRFRDDPASFVGKTDIPQEIIDQSYTYLPISLRKFTREAEKGIARDQPLNQENRTRPFPADWEVFEDEDYGVVIKYPKAWKVWSTIGVPGGGYSPWRDGSLIDTLMLVAIPDPLAQLTEDRQNVQEPAYLLMVEISVFENQGFQSAEEWLMDDGPIYALMDPVRITPVTVNGHEGLYYISNSPLANYIDVFIYHEKYIVRLTYDHITNQVADMDTFWTMLKSLRFRDDPASFDGKTEIPQEIVDESYTYLPVTRHNPSEVVPLGEKEPILTIPPSVKAAVKRDKPLTEENRIKAFPTEWEVLADADYDVEMVYPKGWVIWTNVDQNDNQRFPLRQRSLDDSFMFTALAVFDNRGFESAEEWLKDDEGFYALMDPARITPITINGHEGLYHITEDLDAPIMNTIEVFISNERYIVRLTYANITNQVADMDTFWYMLKSLRFRGDPVSFVGKTEIPQEIIDESYTYLPISFRKLSVE